jgi:hypothetical protein
MVEQILAVAAEEILEMAVLEDPVLYCLDMT